MSIWNGKYVSINNIISKVYRELGLADQININDAVEWCGEALELIGSPGTLIEKVVNIEVKETRAIIPSDVHQIQTIWGYSGYVQSSDPNDDTFIDCVTGFSAMQYSTDTMHFYMEGCNDHRCNSSLTYMVNDNYVWPNFNCGAIRMSYWAIPTDENGYPKIPDQIKFREAVAGHLAWKLARTMLIAGKMSTGLYREFAADRDWYIGAAQTAGQMPGLDMMESLKNNWIRLIPKINQHKDAFSSAGSPEQRTMTGNSVSPNTGNPPNSSGEVCPPTPTTSTPTVLSMTPVPDNVDPEDVYLNANSTSQVYTTPDFGLTIIGTDSTTKTLTLFSNTTSTELFTATWNIDDDLFEDTPISITDPTGFFAGYAGYAVNDHDLSFDLHQWAIDNGAVDGDSYAFTFRSTASDGTYTTVLVSTTVIEAITIVDPCVAFVAGNSTTLTHAEPTLDLTITGSDADTKTLTIYCNTSASQLFTGIWNISEALITATPVTETDWIAFRDTYVTAGSGDNNIDVDLNQWALDNGASHADVYSFTFSARVADAECETPLESLTDTISVQIPLPEVPTNFQATPGTGSVVLTWDAATGADQYNVFWKLSSEGSYSSSTFTSDLTYTVTGLTDGLSYDFIIRSSNDAGYSDYATTLSSTPTGNLPSFTLLSAATRAVVGMDVGNILGIDDLRFDNEHEELIDYTRVEYSWEDASSNVLSINPRLPLNVSDVGKDITLKVNARDMALNLMTEKVYSYGTVTNTLSLTEHINDEREDVIFWDFSDNYNIVTHQPTESTSSAYRIKDLNGEFRLGANEGRSDRLVKADATPYLTASTGINFSDAIGTRNYFYVSFMVKYTVGGGSSFLLGNFTSNFNGLDLVHEVTPSTSRLVYGGGVIRQDGIPTGEWGVHTMSWLPDTDTIILRSKFQNTAAITTYLGGVQGTVPVLDITDVGMFESIALSTRAGMELDAIDIAGVLMSNTTSTMKTTAEVDAIHEALYLKLPS